MAEHTHAAHGWPAGYRIQRQWEIAGAVAEASQPAWLTADTVSGEARLVRQMDLSLEPERQQQEWSLWAELPRHPNVTRTFVRGEEQGIPLTVSEFIGGTNLDHWMGREQLTARPERVLRFALQIVWGLQHARHHGIPAHGNLIPRNCLIAPGEVLKLTDFGAARVWALPEENASRAALLATPAMLRRLPYLAPERFDHPLQVNIGSDLYSLGVLLFEMLAGAPPVQAASWDEYRALHEQQGSPVVSIQPDSLRWLLEGCLEPDPKRRLADLDAVQRSLLECWQQMVQAPEPRPLQGTELEAQQHVERSAGLRALGRLPEALAALDEAAALAPHALSVLWQRVGLLMDEERFAEALDAYDALRRVSPEPQEVLAQKGDLYYRLEKNRSALECYDEALHLDPNLERAWFHKAIIMEEVGREADAISLYDHLLRLNPEHGGALSNKAGLLFAMGMAPEALAALDRAIALDPGNGMLNFNKGALLALAFQRFEEALEWLEKAQALGVAEAADAIATTREALGEQREALHKSPTDGMVQ